MNIEEIIHRLQSGDAFGLAKAITLVENRRGQYKKILQSIYPLKKTAFKLGITGAPGSGKSTLVDRIISHLSSRKTAIGVLAVDPSSPISGGALLGDRIRMLQHSIDPNVFIRSMASRGSLGGLSAAAFETIDLMAAAGKETILVETVGVGQSEIDVVAIADLVLTVLTPSSGDEIQMFKAGLIEITDLFIINKSDLGGAETKVREIENYFHDIPQPPAVVTVSAKTGEGIDGLILKLDTLRSERKKIMERKRKLVSHSLISKIVLDKIKEEMQKRPEIGRLMAEATKQNIFVIAEDIFKALCRGGGNDPSD